MSDEQSSIGIVIPTYNNQADLAACLASIPATRAEIVVVDNASTDGTAEYVAREHPNVTLIRLTKNTGYVGGVNRGWQYLRAKNTTYLFILTQDVVLEHNTLDLLVSALDNDATVAAAQPLLCYQNDHNRINSMGNRIHYLGFGYAEGDGMTVTDPALQERLSCIHDIVYPSGGAVMLRSGVLREVGLFQDEFFMYHDDLDLGWRLRLAGHRSVLVPESRAYHRYEFHRSTTIKYEYGERNRLLVLIENYHWATLLLILPAWIVMEVGIVAFSLQKGWFRAKLRGYQYVVKRMAMILSVRHSHQTLRRRRERQVVRDFVGTIEYQQDPSILLSFANPFFDGYWKLIRRCIFW